MKPKPQFVVVPHPGYHSQRYVCPCCWSGITVSRHKYEPLPVSLLCQKCKREMKPRTK